ncbi:MAG TPA: 2-succinyl-5-enolpyruvyl-6-hydroxy-3-cyclohexene-1-carboxylic-acid synthase [Opitutaceae bacterium]|nr:2-succinyl-5-enolpyruvyl-6-hydroxy-3-cyclohexene-1-carboxylic-acid synthase [Opitutaceae bacterium]
MNPPPVLDFRNVNSLWCSVLAETLARLGLKHAVISPGSRSTPLTIALAGHPAIEAIPVLDERSAAFFAIGLARQHHRPVVLVCTSGTAGANYFPAVIEAQESGAPLIVITADRPPEMRECASGQTIDQQKLFGAHVNFYHELAVPEPSLTLLAYLRQTVRHAFAAAVGIPPGPVHLNAPFRDPLAPIDDGMAAGMTSECDWEKFFELVLPPAAVEVVAAVPPIPPDVHGLIVAGPVQPADAAGYAQTVAIIATKLGWPVLADGLSPLRHYAALQPHLVTTYDLLLRNPAIAGRLRPERVLCLGGWPISKVLRAAVVESGAPILLVGEGAQNRDALHGRTQHLRISLRIFAAQLPQAADPNGYQRLWASFERKARAALDARLQAATEMFEGRAAWLLAQHLPAETPVFIANSMPVRDVEYFTAPNDRHLRPLFNRGANGIDGTLSTALGIAHGGRPAVLLTGDLALLHDTNGFLLPPKLSGSLTIVLINNRGGGIFEHLPVAEFDPPFEDFFATPQHVDFAKLCAAYGIAHTMVRDWAHFIELTSALPAGGIRVLEVRTNRKRDAEMRKQMFAELAAALG